MHLAAANRAAAACRLLHWPGWRPPRRPLPPALARRQRHGGSDAPSPKEHGRQRRGSHDKGGAPDKALPSADFRFRSVGPAIWELPAGAAPGMRVPVRLFASHDLLKLLEQEVDRYNPGGFLPALQQLVNVATLPGIVGASLGMPDVHSGYAFAIGHVAAFDMEPGAEGIVSPGGVGYDISCGVRLLRTDLGEADLTAKKRSQLADALAELIPVGVGEGGAVKLTRSSLGAVLREGMKWTEREGLSWPEDREVCEEGGCYAGADPGAVSDAAKKRGLKELGSLGSGNHYCEVQVVDAIFDPQAAAAMGIDRVGQVCVMIHTGSRGLGHQVCQDALQACQRRMAEEGVHAADPQLSFVPIHSPEGQSYLKAMAAAANFALSNRTVVQSCVRSAFERVFGRSARQMGMHLVYDVSHNLAKPEEHVVDGKRRRLLVHRKGATRAFPPHHPAVPARYRGVGQPVLIGGSMGTASYVLVGSEAAMEESFGSTAHGAGRLLSRSQALKQLDSKGVLRSLADQGIEVRVATQRLAAEEAPASYKDVEAVVDACHAAGISRKAVRLRPVAVIKG